MQRIGLISDTHKLLRPEAVSFLRGSDHIIHAGDLVTPDALQRLAELAPVTAVRGNNDRGAWAAGLRETELLEVDDVRILVIHNLHDLAIGPRETDVRVVVSGHSHRPRIEEREGVLYVNPGSAGPRRFRLPISVGELRIEGGRVEARIKNL